MIGARKLCSGLGVTETVCVSVSVAVSVAVITGDTDTVSVAVVVLVLVINTDSEEEGGGLAGIAREMLTPAAGVGLRVLLAATESCEGGDWCTIKYTPTPRPIAAILTTAPVRQMSQRRVCVAEVQRTILMTYCEI